MASAFTALVVGQSNAANHGASPARLDDPRARAFHAGRFAPLIDPLPGGSGTGGSVWTRLAPLLLDGGAHDGVTVAVAAAGGLSIADLAPGGRAHPLVTNALAAASDAGLAFSHVLIHQGERDTLLGTSRSAYREALQSLVDRLRADCVAAPVFVCRASYRFGVTSDEVRAAQASVIEAMPGVYAGPDTDALGPECRTDNTHFSDRGLERFAALWAESLSAADAPGAAAALREAV